MEKSEPTLVPEWLKSSGSLTGSGTTIHQFASSSLHSDNHVLLKPVRNKSSVNINDYDLGRSSDSNRTGSSSFRRSSSSNGYGHLRSSNSFGRSHRDKDWDKDLYEQRDKEKSVLGNRTHRDYSDLLGNILPSRFEKDSLRWSQSTVSGKSGEPWPRKLAGDSTNANKNNHNHGSLMNDGGSPIRSVQKAAAFERDFPSLGTEERHADTEIGRVPSPGLSTAIQNLPVGSSAVIGGDGWTSALAEVPVIVGSNGTIGSSVQQDVHVSSASGASNPMTGLNMAETLAQGPTRVQTTPQLSVGIQRLEELAIKQSRQLIPVTPSMAKTLVLNPLEKLKLKVGQQPRGGSASSVGKLHILKPARERNGVSLPSKDSSSPTGVSKGASSPLSVAPPGNGSAPLRMPGNISVLASADRKPAPTILEKRPTSQAQSRNDFFNLVRKKSLPNSSSTVPPDPAPAPAMSPSVLEKPAVIEAAAPPVTPHGGDAPLSDRSSGGAQFNMNRDELTQNGDACDGPQKSLINGKKHSSSDVILYSEEEEAAFLRSLGWEENGGEDEGLTEEEINAFYRDYMKSKPSKKF